MDAPREPLITPARIDWSGDAPRASGGDIYFHPTDGLAESRAVFLDGVGAPDLWQGRPSVTVGETGFGTGLNFLATWQRWRETCAPNARLHFLSVEQSPPSHADAVRALGAFPELEPMARALLAEWPEPLPGIRSHVFDAGRVTLTLGIGDAVRRLAEMTAAVDAWFLDGFAPSLNPDLWSDGVFRELARLSAPGARLATFSAAGAVRRGLAAAGFVVEKQPGFRAKRERLVGQFKGSLLREREPWFAPPDPIKTDAEVLVIGGGIAGVAAASALDACGFAVTLVDRTGVIGQEASGNFAGLVKPRLALGNGPESPFHEQAFIQSVRTFDALEKAWEGRRGVLDLAADADEEIRFEKIRTSVPWPDDWLRFMNAAEASEHLGRPVRHGGLWHPKAGTVIPPALCRAIAGALSPKAATVAQLSRHGDRWRCLDADGETVAEADAVIFAGGAWLDRMGAPQSFEIRANRGQIGCLPPSEAAGTLPAIAGAAYLTGPFDGALGRGSRVIGASYLPWDDPDDLTFREPRAASFERPLQDLQGLLPDAPDLWPTGPSHGRASLRATTPDHLPVAGPVLNTDILAQNYKRWAGRGLGDRESVFEPGLFVLGGLGSRGLQTAPKLAALLAAQLTGTPWPLAKRLADAVHPARFLVRTLKRSRP